MIVSTTIQFEKFSWPTLPHLMRMSPHRSSLIKMARTPYHLTSSSPRDYYSCSTYAPDLSTRYGICETLDPVAGDSSTIDLSSRSLLGVSAGDWVAGFFLLLLLGIFVGMYLGCLRWFIYERMSRRGWRADTVRRKKWGAIRPMEPVGRRLVNRVRRWSRRLKNRGRKRDVEVERIERTFETFQKSFGI
jgi:hypothetical protein